MGFRVSMEEFFNLYPEQIMKYIDLMVGVKEEEQKAKDSVS